MKIGKVYILTLDPIESKPEIIRKLRDCGLPGSTPYEIVKGFDGRYGDIPNEYKIYKHWNLGSDHWNSWWKRPILPGEIGCAIGHILIWKKIISDNINSCLILEDDFLCSGKYSITDICEPIQSKWDISLLGRSKIDVNSIEQEIDSTWVRSNHFYNMHAYVIKTPAVAKKLLSNKFQDNLIPVDEYISALGYPHRREDIRNIYPQNLNILSIKDLNFIVQNRSKDNSNIEQNFIKGEKNMLFTINKELDVSLLRSQYEKSKSIVIEDFLDDKSVETLYNFFTNDMPEDWWHTSYRIPSLNNDVQHIRRTAENVKHINNIYNFGWKDFNKGLFTYIFDRSLNHYSSCTCIECKFKQFLVSDEMKTFIYNITGEKITTLGEVFSSRYTSGQFLSPHHDIDKGKFSLVYSLSKNWKPEWGGNLYLLEDDWVTIKKCILSSYNRLALTLMNSPIQGKKGTPHFVSQIANGVTEPRLSITGWVS